MSDFINVGVGIDIVEINRFKQRPYPTNQSFYTKIFSEDEINYCLKFSDPYPHFAGKFTIKESVIKSIPIKIQPHDIITSHKNSKPIVKLKPSRLKDYNFLVSVSHENKFAIANSIKED